MNTLLLLGSIGFLGFLCQWLSATVKLPAILFLLLSGILIGPVLGIFDPNAVFGDLLFPFISLSVAVILFEGALTLDRRELKEIGSPAQRMVTIGVLINSGVITVATHYLLGLSWSLSALFGALMVVTGPTVIMPMLKTVRPKSKIGDVLRWEGIVIDPIGALFAVLVFEWIAVQNSSAELTEVFLVFSGTVFIGFFIGITAGYLFGLLLRHHWMPEKLNNFGALASVCFVFALSDGLMHESGLLAVTVMGMWLANMKGVHIDPILEFKEDLTVVFVSILFIVLAARLDFNGFSELGWSALLILLVMQFVARPLKVVVSFLGSDFTWQERAMVSWIGPRGIVAAAISSVFALRLSELGVQGAELLVPLAFLIIIGTVVIQSLTARPVAKLLKVALPSTQGVVIIGANPFSVQVANALSAIKVDSVICDSDWEKLRLARSEGLRTYYGNPSSEHAHIHMDLAPYGKMLGLSSHFEYNIAQANSFREDFGARGIFSLAPNQDTKRFHKHVVASHKGARILFSEALSYKNFNNRISEGWRVKTTELTDEFNFERWRESNPDAIFLFVRNKDGQITFNSTDMVVFCESGDLIAYFSPV